MQALKASNCYYLQCVYNQHHKKDILSTKFIIVCALTILEGSKFMNLVKEYPFGVRRIVYFLLAVRSQTSRMSQNLLSIVTTEFQGCLQEFYGICWDFTESKGICWNFMEWSNLMATHGVSRNVMEAHVILRNLTESPGISRSRRIEWNQTESDGLSKNLMESQRISWNFMEN